MALIETKSSQINRLSEEVILYGQLDHQTLRRWIFSVALSQQQQQQHICNTGN